MIKKLHSFNIVNFKVDGGAMFGVVPKIIWSNYIPADENNCIPLALRSLVVETEDRKLLIDCGIGQKQGKKFLSRLSLFGGEGLIGGLAGGGYAPEDITDVLLTHLHFDHCGGSLEKDPKGDLYPVFPNARYHISRKQFDNAKDPNIREADAILPENIFPLEQMKMLDLIDQETELFPGLAIRMVDGHTPGQVIPVIHFAGARLVYGGDLFPTRAHVPVKYNMAYDLEVTKSMEEKQAFLEEFNQAGDAIFFEHDVVSECGIPEKTEKGYRVKTGMSLEEWVNARRMEWNQRIQD